MRLFAQRSFEAASLFGGSGLDDAFGRTEASVKVNHDTALSDDAIFAAVSLIAGDIANLPMKAFQTTESGLTQLCPRQPSWLDMPDPLDQAITDVAHKTQIALSVLLAGDAFVLAESSVFDPESLTVLNPVRVRVIKPKRERLFQIMARSNIYEDWQPRDVLDTYSSAQVLQIPYMLRPGRLTGLSPIDAQTGNVGISLAARKWVETFFGKGGQVSGFVALPPTAPAGEAEKVEERIVKKWSSWRRGGIIGVLSGGANWVKSGLSPQDADLPNLWRRQLEMAARIYGIPPFMIGSQEPAGVAYASSVERAQHYIDHCLARYTRPIEKAYSRLVPGDGRPGSSTEVRFVFDAFLRGDPKARWDTYLAGLQAKARTIGEIRALENLPPLSDYDQDYLEGPDGLLQTPNNNPRQFPAGDQGPTPPGDTPDAPLPPTAPGTAPDNNRNLPQFTMGMPSVTIPMSVQMPEQPVTVNVPAQRQPIVNVAAAPAPVVNVAAPDMAPIAAALTQQTEALTQQHSETLRSLADAAEQKSDVRDVRVVSMPKRTTKTKKNVARNSQGLIVAVSEEAVEE